MTNIIKVLLIGGATYLAFDYIMKRKANKGKQSLLIAKSNGKNVVPSIKEAEVEADLEENGVIEFDEKRLGASSYGDTLETAQKQQIGDGWDSDSLPTGL